MTRYIVLLRGINVGGKNIIKMAQLRAAFELRGFNDVSTYINSGNVVLTSRRSATFVRDTSQDLLVSDFGVETPAFVMVASELQEALSHAPDWWGLAPDTRHNAFFVLPPRSAEELCNRVGTIEDQYEQCAYYGRVIFWSASIKTFSRTRWGKISQQKELYNAITVRNANTTRKLAQLGGYP